MTPSPRDPRVVWDGKDRSWRIEIWQPNSGSENFGVPSWWRLLWLRFASAEVAEEHLLTRGPR